MMRDDAIEYYLDLLASVGEWFRLGWFIVKAAYTGIKYVLRSLIYGAHHSS
jgi:hypothetical protein